DGSPAKNNDNFSRATSTSPTAHPPLPVIVTFCSFMGSFMDTKPTTAPSRRSRLSLLVAGLALASSLHAQDATHALNLPAQPLDQAINALAGQTGSRILFATDVAEGLNAPAVSGDLTVQQALQR